MIYILISMVFLSLALISYLLYELFSISKSNSVIQQLHHTKLEELSTKFNELDVRTLNTSEDVTQVKKDIKTMKWLIDG